MLVIYRPPEFGSDGQPVRGQCQPHLKGWRLVRFHRGESETLHTDTYYTCRRIQQKCATLSVEETAAVIEEAKQQIAASQLETQTMPSSGETTRDAPLPGGGAKNADAEESKTVILRPGQEDGTVILSREEMDESLRRDADADD